MCSGRSSEAHVIDALIEPAFFIAAKPGPRGGSSSIEIAAGSRALVRINICGIVAHTHPVVSDVCQGRKHLCRWSAAIPFSWPNETALAD